jgi:peptide deformylase
MSDLKFEIIPNKQTPKVNDFNIILEDEARSYIEEHKETLEAFLEFAKQQENAVGLATNQCSINDKRLNWIHAFAYLDQKTDQWSLKILPIIHNCIGLIEEKVEGCLTWKNKKIIAERYRAVTVDYFDIDGKLHKEEFYKGFEAQIWQHEINHLNGISEDVVELDYPEPRPIEVGRNDNCPCGSGKKYKKCCWLLK